MSEQPYIERVEDELDELLEAARNVLAHMYFGNPKGWPCDCSPARENPDGSATPLFDCPYCVLQRIVDRHDRRIQNMPDVSLAQLRALLDSIARWTRGDSDS